IAAVEKVHKKQQEDLKKIQDRYEVRIAGGKGVVDKAKIALESGLGEKALQVLMEADVNDLKAEGSQLELELLLTMGRLDELRQAVTAEGEKEAEKGSGPGFLEMYRFRLAAAEGDYKTADKVLADIAERTLTDEKVRQTLRLALRLEAKEPG